MLIIALQFGVSTSCNEKIKINKMYKKLYSLFCVYVVTSLLVCMRLPSGGRCMYLLCVCMQLPSGGCCMYLLCYVVTSGLGSQLSAGWLPIPTKY